MTKYLLDTNIVLRFSNPSDEHHGLVTESVAVLLMRAVAQPFHHHLFDHLRPPMPSRCQVHAPMADNGSADVMGRGAGDRPKLPRIHGPGRNRSPSATRRLLL
jgi:hypothetical protein